jgi:hypothetical protein
MNTDGTFALDYTLMEALMVYLDYGLDPGSGGRAVLLLDVEKARARMHELSRYTASDMVECVRRYFPKDAVGSQEKIEAWLANRGIFGPNMEDEQVLYKLGHAKYNAIKALKTACEYKPLGKQ